MSSKSRRPSDNIPNTSARITGYRPSPSGPYIPHGLDVLPLKPLHIHHTLTGLRIQRQLATDYMRRLREYDAILAQTASGLAQRSNDYRVLLQQIMIARQDVDEEDEEYESEGGNTQSDTESNAMDVDSDGSDGSDDGDDDDGDGIDYMSVGSRPANNPTNINPPSHAQVSTVITPATVNAVQQPDPIHIPVIITGSSNINSNFQLPTPPPSPQPIFTMQHLPSPPQTPPPGKGQSHLRGGRASPPHLNDDQANIAESYRSFGLDRRRLRQAYVELVNRVVEQRRADIRPSLSQLRELRTLARRILEGETDVTERRTWSYTVSHLEENIQLTEIAQAAEASMAAAEEKVARNQG
ncbi:MAG: hypothetical protein L6R38_001724 [Xanthoria sp. 2 TBL-2021]|nr:MAG: hypothetical protein L6R38_001724 [Xanthoria sp. 2 TBL-2021]